MHCTTRRVVESYSFTWTIENLHTFFQPVEAESVIKSLAFPPLSEESKCKWTLLYYPFGSDTNIGDSIEVGLSTYTKLYKIKLDDEDWFTTHCCLYFRDARDSEFRKCTKEVDFSSEGCYCALDKVDRKWLLQKVGTDDVLKIHIEIFYVIGKVTESCQKEYYSQVTPELGLVEDFSAMFLEQKHSDIVIVAKGTEFKAHQNVLSARCSVMEAMLKHDTEERQQKLIEINDIEPEIVQKLLRFMYTSQVDYTNTDSAMKLLVAADMYCLEVLKHLVGEYLALNISIANVLDILNVAELHHDQQLKSCALDFVCKHRHAFGDAEKFSGYMKNPQMLVDILTRLAIDPQSKES